MAISASTHTVAAEVEQYIEAHLFDAQGIMYSQIDAFNHCPYDRSFITSRKVPRRADIDPWAFWTYEDSVLASGLYADAMTLKYETTSDTKALEAAGVRWRVLRNIYAASQVHGIGSFMRPYGGYVQMHQFFEPLGTDQASPMFSGTYRYMKHADERTRSWWADNMLKTLRWYEQQQFSYFYYKFMIHEYTPGTALCKHPTSYYLPAVAWAAKETGDKLWADYRDARLPLIRDGEHNLAECFIWGSDLLVLRDILGDAFADTFTQDVLDAGYAHVKKQLEAYNEPGMLKRLHAASKEPGFKPYVHPSYDRSRGMGFAYFQTVHGGRTRPRHEMHVLAALAAMDYPNAFDDAVNLLELRQRVPLDFTAFHNDDYNQLPEEVHLYARGAGVNMVGWLRDYWLLRSVEARHAAI